jgi:hypothetical protein
MLYTDHKFIIHIINSLSTPQHLNASTPQHCENNMLKTQTLSSSVITIAVSDLAALIGIYFIPSLSHALAFPLYMFEPMRIVLFTAYLFSRNHTNALILALTLPLFSMLSSGHPILPKALLMSGELFINVLFFILLLKHTKWGVFLSLLSATLVSKLLYYGVKFLLIRGAVFEDKLISTPVLTQMIIALVIAVFFAIVYREKESV